MPDDVQLVEIDHAREKLIELLFGCISKNITPELKGSNELTIKIYHGNIADHLIANGVTVQKWIPVTERLPDRLKRHWCRCLAKNHSQQCERYSSRKMAFGMALCFIESRTRSPTGCHCLNRRRE